MIGILEAICDEIHYQIGKRKGIRKYLKLIEFNELLKKAYQGTSDFVNDKELSEDVENIKYQLDKLTNRYNQIVDACREDNMTAAKQYYDIISHEQDVLIEMKSEFENRWNIQVGVLAD